MLCLVALLLASAHARRAPEAYQDTFLGHRSYKWPDQMRSATPLYPVVDGRDNSYVEREATNKAPFRSGFHIETSHE